VLDPLPPSPEHVERRLRVLLVEDHEDTREVYRVFLETAGIDVATADDGLSAVRAARAGSPDVIVMDVRMPGLDGHDVVNVLRGREDTQAIPIVLVTGAVGPEKPQPDLGAADLVLTKPCLPEDVLAAVRGLTVGFAEGSGIAL